MSRPPSEEDEQRRKVEAANARLVCHERLSRIVLLLVLLLCAGLLVLLLTHIWDIREADIGSPNLIPHSALPEFSPEAIDGYSTLRTPGSEGLKMALLGSRPRVCSSKEQRASPEGRGSSLPDPLRTFVGCIEHQRQALGV